MKYLIAILLMISTYVWGRINSYREISHCADAYVKEANPEAVHIFYGHKTYDKAHHLAYAYKRALECMLRRDSE